MRRKPALVLTALLLGCPSWIGDDGPCGDAWAKRAEANKAVETAAKKYEGACRQTSATGCETLSEFRDLEGALRLKGEADKAADACTTELMRGKMGRM